MNFPIARADNEVWLRPRLAAKPFGQIFGAHQAEERNDRRVALAENHGAFADDDQPGLAPGGFFACVFPHEAAQLARVEAGAREAGLVIVRKRPVVFREGDPALVALFGLMRAEDLPDWFRGQTWTEPDLIIRTRAGKIHPEYSAVKLAIGFPP